MPARVVWQHVSFKYSKNITLYDVICRTDNEVYDTLIGYLCKYIYRVNLLNQTEYADNSKIKQDLIRELCFIQKLYSYTNFNIRNEVIEEINRTVEGIHYM